MTYHQAVEDGLARARQTEAESAPFDYVGKAKELAVEWVVRRFGISAGRAELLREKVGAGHAEHGEARVDVDAGRELEIVDLIGYTSQGLVQELRLEDDECELIEAALRLWDLHDAIRARRATRDA